MFCDYYLYKREKIPLTVQLKYKWQSNAMERSLQINPRDRDIQIVVEIVRVLPTQTTKIVTK